MRIPYITVALIIFQICVFLLVTRNEDIFDYILFNFSLIPHMFLMDQDYGIYRLITAPLIHIELDHIFFNMSIFLFGSWVLERYLTKIAYISLCLIGLIVPTYIQYLSNPMLEIPFIGSSGLGCSILGGFMIYYILHFNWKYIHYLMYFLLSGYILIMNLIDIQLPIDETRNVIGYQAHLSGYCIGILYMLTYILLSKPVKVKHV